MSSCVRDRPLFRRIGVGLLVVVGLGGFVWRQAVRFRPVRREPPAAVTLSLYCGAALRPLVEALAEDYHRRTGVTVAMTYGGANLLMGQLELVPGEADLFLPGDSTYVEEAAARGWIEEQVPLARLTPALLVQPGNPCGIEGLRDLVRPGVRVAMPDPRGPALSRLVPDLLAAEGMTESDIVSNVVFTAASLPELAHAVRLGHADAALVWEFYARHQAPCEAIPIPLPENRSVVLSIGLLRTSKQKAEARRFMEYVRSESARPLWRKGYVSTFEEEQR